MELDIFWTEFAKDKLHQIFDYHREKASLNVARKLINGIYNATLN